MVSVKECRPKTAAMYCKDVAAAEERCSAHNRRCLLKKQYMLKKNKEFRYVVSRGKSVASAYMVLICAKNRTGIKVGFSVSSKLGNAVVRNRTKRIMRAGFTPLMPDCRRQTAYLFIARKALVGKSSLVAQQEMRALLLQAGMMS